MKFFARARNNAAKTKVTGKTALTPNFWNISPSYRSRNLKHDPFGKVSVS